uniref:Uncharacterized protein n=1 Tax=Rhizobium phage IG49 TaxID=3129228 RepID=A0AAU8HZH2_9CAUD
MKRFETKIYTVDSPPWRRSREYVEAKVTKVHSQRGFRFWKLWIGFMWLGETETKRVQNDKW